MAEQDEFEKALSEQCPDAMLRCQSVLEEYRAFKAKQKPTAPASLVEELKMWFNKTLYLPDIDGDPVIESLEFATAQSDVNEILSHFESRKEVVLAKSKGKHVRTILERDEVTGSIWELGTVACNGTVIFVEEDDNA